MNKQEIRYFTDLDEMSGFAAEYIKSKSDYFISKKGSFNIAVSGGTTPKKLFSIFASLECFKNYFQWNRTHFFWVDERYVPADSDDSNFKGANDLLFSKVEIPPENIHKIDTSAANPAVAAAKYEKTLRNFFRTDNFPAFDMILLGMGEDGHTASLFPGTEVLSESVKWVAAAPAPLDINPKVPRVTLTYPVINSAEYVLFLIGGETRNAIAEKSLKDKRTDYRKYPAAGVRPRGQLLWLAAK